jgi:hypothetical protein
MDNAMRPQVPYKKEPADAVELARLKIEADTKKFLAGGGKIEKLGVHINGKEVKQTRQMNRERLRTEGWKRLNTMQTEGKRP